MAWIILVGVVAGGAEATAARPLAMRIENFTVQPSSQPILAVTLRNISDRPFAGSLAPVVPAMWQITPAVQPVSLAAGASTRITFSVDRAVDAPPHVYPLEIAVRGGDADWVQRQTVRVTSTPYSRPTIDGDPADWEAALPVSFTTAGHQTTVSTFWNRRSFSLLVAVAEDRLVARDQAAACDGVQFALASRDARTGTAREGPADRFEFLLVADASLQGKCYQLAQPGLSLATAVEPRPLDTLPVVEAKVAVRRAGGVTYYECSVPLGPMRQVIRPSEGRSYQFSLLVHDPDGTGLRDLGAALGLEDFRRNPLAWSRWLGAQWNAQPPLDSKIEWGFCSSRY